jgi:hypothetical protein
MVGVVYTYQYVVEQRCQAVVECEHLRVYHCAIIYFIYFVRLGSIHTLV